MCDALRELFADELEKREERGIECGIEQGGKQGVLLNLVYQARRKKDKGMAVEEVAEILEADEQLVQRMYQVPALRPESTNIEIVELLKM